MRAPIQLLPAREGAHSFEKRTFLRRRGPPCFRALALPLLLLLCLAFSTAHAQSYYYVGIQQDLTLVNFTCDGTISGTIRYNTGTSTFEGCNGTTWGSLASGAIGNLGTSAAATAPQKTGDATTGFYSDAASTVEVAAGGIKVEQWNTLASGVDYFSLTPGKSGTNIKLAVAGTTANASIDIAPKGTGNINFVTGALQMAGNTVFWVPGAAIDSTGQSLAIGNGTLAADSSGQYNLGVGYQALPADTSGSQNVAIGVQTLQYDTTGSSNTAVGDWALEGVAGTPLTGSWNTAVGNASLANIQGAAHFNTGVGGAALGSLTTGIDDTGLGTDALQSLATGNDNTAVGFNVLLWATGNNNTAVGSLAIGNATTGTNTGVGYAAGEFITTGSANTAIGTSALQGITGVKLTGSNNTAVGDSALLMLQGAAASNTAVGYQAGDAGTAITTGTNNTFIGYQAQANSATASNRTAIGNGAIASADNQIMLGNTSVATVRTNGHMETHGTAPTVSACGTGATISGNDNAMIVTTGSSSFVATCTVTFANAWTNTPICNVNHDRPSGGGSVYSLSAASTTAISVVASTAPAAAYHLYVSCVGYY